MKQINNPNAIRAEKVMKKWPEWKRNYQFTKYKSELSDQKIKLLQHLLPEIGCGRR